MISRYKFFGSHIFISCDNMTGRSCINNSTVINGYTFRDFYLRADGILSSTVTILHFHRNTVISLRLRKYNNERYVKCMYFHRLNYYYYYYRTSSRIEIGTFSKKEEYFNLEFLRVEIK